MAIIWLLVLVLVIVCYHDFVPNIESDFIESFPDGSKLNNDSSSIQNRAELPKLKQRRSSSIAATVSLWKGKSGLICVMHCIINKVFLVFRDRFHNNSNLINKLFVYRAHNVICFKVHFFDPLILLRKIVIYLVGRKFHLHRLFCC